MGKLGGGELNVSSDIDLVFVYPEDGETDGARPVVEPRVLRPPRPARHRRAGRRHRRRLRVPRRHAAAAVRRERSADRAVRRARAVPRSRRGARGSATRGSRRAPLTGARHDELDRARSRRSSSASTSTTTPTKACATSIARSASRASGATTRPTSSSGPGGIREIEFIVQALQLVRGGREPALRVRGTLRGARRARRARAAARRAPCAALRDAYVFLRNVEHRLQYRDDRQTQTLPDGSARARGARATRSGFADAPALRRALAAHRDAVSAQFDAAVRRRRAAALAATPTRRSAPDLAHALAAAIWRGDVTPSTARETLARGGLRRSRRRSSPSSRACARARRYVAAAGAVAPARRRAGAAAAARSRRPSASTARTRRRCSSACSRCSKRSAGAAPISRSLIEHPPVLPRLAQLMGASRWAADYLTRHPLLLDELLDARVLLAEPDWDAWRDGARAPAAPSTPATPSGRWTRLRHFQHAQTFRLLAQDLAGLLTVERLADHLSALADIVLAATLAAVLGAAARRATRRRRASRSSATASSAARSWATRPTSTSCSCYDDPTTKATRRSATRASRSGSSPGSRRTTAAGPLYDTDLRLRPDGAAGLLVVVARARSAATSASTRGPGSTRR